MAEIISNGTGYRKAGVKRCRKLTTRVDLTPMVDLGFLLITFFIFTTTLSAPRALALIVPAKGDSTETQANRTLNLVLSDQDHVHYYIGNEVWKQGCTDFSPQGVRKLIASMQQQMRERFGKDEEIVVLIRPTEACSYKNIVDILDELLIMNVRKYALMDSPPNETLAAGNIRKPC